MRRPALSPGFKPARAPRTTSCKPPRGLMAVTNRYTEAPLMGIIGLIVGVLVLLFLLQLLF